MPPPATRLTPWRRVTRARRRQLVWVVAALGGIAATAAGAEPTTLDAVNAVLALTVTVVVTWLASRARRWTLPFVAAPSLALGTTIALVFGIASALLAIAVARETRRDRVLAAACAAVGLQGLFRLDGGAYPFTLTTLAAAGACLPLVASAVLTMPSRLRRRVVIGAGATTAVATVLGAFAIFAGQQARSKVTDGINASRHAVALVKDEERDASAAAFAEAAAAFGDAADAVDAPWARLARALPVASQNLVAVDELARAGADLATITAAEVAALDLDTLAVADGRIDLAVLDDLSASSGRIIDATTTALAAVDTTLAHDRSGWLVDELTTEANDLRTELAENLRTAQDTEEILAAAPWLLGADAPRQYLILFTTPAEARELGGFVGAYGILHADEGEIRFEPKGSIGPQFRELRDADASLPDDLELADFYELQRPEVYPQNWTGTPDFPTVAAVAQHLLGFLDESYDGVLLVDPIALAQFATYTGPIEIPEADLEVPPEQMVDFLLRDQYLVFEGQSGTRKELLPQVAHEVFGDLVGGLLPSPRGLVDDLAPLVEGRRLLFTVDDPAADALLDRVGLTGTIVPSTEPGVESLMLTSTTTRANKLDAYMRREVRWEPTVRVDGTVEGDVVVTIVNEVPPIETLNDYVTGTGSIPDGLPEGTWQGYVTLHSTMRITDVDTGSPVDVGRESFNGMTWASVLVEVPQGERLDIRFTIDDLVDRRNFAVDYLPFPGAQDDLVEISLP